MTTVRLETASGGYSVALPTLSYRTMPLWRLVAPGPNGAVGDVEALCVGVLEETIRRAAPPYIDRDESLAFLLGEVVVLLGKYDPAKRHGSGSFQGYLYDRLRFRLVDYWRAWNGRTGQKTVAGAGGPGGPEQPAEGDSGNPWDDAGGWLLAAGDRDVLLEVAALGLGPPPGAGGRAHGATRAARGPTVGPWRDCSCGWRNYLERDPIAGWHVPACCADCGAPILDVMIEQLDLDQDAAA